MDFKPRGAGSDSATHVFNFPEEMLGLSLPLGDAAQLHKAAA